MRTRMINGLTPALTHGLDGFGLFDDAFRALDRAFRAPTAARNLGSALAGPEIGVEKTESGWRLRADMPGLRPEDLEVEAHGDHLTIRAQRAVEVPEGFEALHRERGSLRFERSFQMRDGIDAEGVTAKLSEGVLTIEVPKPAAKQPRSIQVSAS